MTRGEAIKDFFCKTILPVAAAALLYCIFRMSRSVRQGFDQVVPPADDTSVRDHHGTDGYFLLF